jgi:hypothetical protein
MKGMMAKEETYLCPLVLDPAFILANVLGKSLKLPAKYEHSTEYFRSTIAYVQVHIRHYRISTGN